LVKYAATESLRKHLCGNGASSKLFLTPMTRCYCMQVGGPHTQYCSRPTLACLPSFHSQHVTSVIFWRQFVKRFALCYRTVSVCIVTLVYCGETVGWIKMKLGMAVGLVPGHIVLDGTQLPPPKKKGHFSAHVYCGQTAGWIKMPLGTEVDLGPGHIVDGDPVSSRDRGTAPSPLFGSCLVLWPNGRPFRLLMSTCLKAR